MPYYVTDDHCRLYYEERGPKDGKNVIFIHGGGCSHYFYKRNVPEFAKKFHVVTYDQRCHGNSERVEHGVYFERMAQDLKELMEYLDLKDVTLIGHSMGANIIWQYVKDNGCENIAKVVIYEMSPKMLTDDEWKLGFGPAHDVLEYYRMQAGHYEDLGFYWSAVSMFGEGEWPQEDISWTMDQMAYSDCPISVYIQCCDSDYRDVVPKVTVPCLITYGTRKSLYTPEVSQWVAEHCGGPTFDGGHMCCFQDADHWNRVVMEFIAKPLSEFSEGGAGNNSKETA